MQSNPKPYHIIAAYIILIAIANFEANFFIEKMPSLFQNLEYMTAALFTHNTFSSFIVLTTMYCTATLIYHLPERFRKREEPILKHYNLLAAGVAVIIIVASFFRIVNFPVTTKSILLSIPIAAIEACGIYIAASAGIQRKISFMVILQIIVIFLLGAITETALITCIMNRYL
ncbi:MAG: hypothetical protein NWF09_08945 [Candidatus Bathyarchaeota archaeon]|nr:hypothetical protein [Candidatus Bathyarchaeota archaeon]